MHHILKATDIYLYIHNLQLLAIKKKCMTEATYIVVESNYISDLNRELTKGVHPALSFVFGFAPATNKFFT